MGHPEGRSGRDSETPTDAIPGNRLMEVMFDALEPRIYLSTFTSVGDGNWSASDTWDQPGTPGDGDTVIISAGDTVTYDATVGGILGDDTDGGLTVQGKLVFDPDTSLDMRLDENLVVDSGELEMRPANANVIHTITFENVDETEFVGGGLEVLDTDVGLWVKGTGILDAIGTEKTPWTRLTGSANSGDNTITVEDASGWRVGDRLEITPTQSPAAGNAAWSGYDSRTITAVNGNTITLNDPLEHDHPEVNGQWRAEVLNLSRNVKIGGTQDGRAHLLFLHTMQPQTVKNLEVHDMGPRQISDARDPTEGVLGRYGFHFHHAGDHSRGSLIENVVVRDTGNHAFVPHNSHGVTMRGTVSHDTWEDAYWWDPGSANETDDVWWDQAVASKVRDDPSFRGFRLTGFSLAGGQGNTITNSVAVGIQGNKDASGYEWPENTVASPWVYNNNIGHNNKVHGIFTWHNGGTFHLVEDFVMYHNSSSGIDHGAYKNRYTYRNAQLYGNDTAGFELHNVSGNDVISPMLIENMHIDGAGVSDYGIAVRKHNTQVSLSHPTTLRDNHVTNLAPGGSAYAWTYGGIAGGPGDAGGENTGFDGGGNHREWFKLINNSYDGSADDFFFLEGFHNDLDGDGDVDWSDTDGDGHIDEADGGEKYGILEDADIYVEMPSGEIFQLYSIWQDEAGLTDVPQWNAQKEILQQAGTPIVDAGNNASVDQVDTLQLDGNVTDDGVENPPGISAWTKVSGPGTVNFGDPSVIDTTADFSATGQYLLRLTADNGTFSASDDIRVFVNMADDCGVVEETWPGADDDPWPGQWTRQDVHGSMTINTQGGRGYMRAPSGNGRALMYVNSHNGENMDMTTQFSVSSNSAHPGMFARRHDQNSDTYYGVWTEIGHNPVTEIFKVVDGEHTTIKTVASSVNGSADHMMRFRVTSNEDGTDDLRVKIWETGTSEPDAWTAEATGVLEPTLQGVSGRFGITSAASNPHRHMYFDDFEAAILEDTSEVADRHLFYNNSAFDGNDAGANVDDDGAIAPNKDALLPGETATFANYSSYSLGVNGIMIDLAGAPTPELIDASDFEFNVGNNNDLSSWSPLGAAVDVSLRAGAGEDGSDRITLTLPDGAVTGQWLQVTMLANCDTGLIDNDVFYFGNAIGEGGDSDTDAIVNATDFVDTRDNQHGIFDQATITDEYDFNRDKLVNATDMVLSRDHQTSPFTMLQLITAPTMDASGGAVAESSEPVTVEQSTSDATLSESSSSETIVQQESEPVVAESSEAPALSVETVEFEAQHNMPEREPAAEYAIQRSAWQWRAARADVFGSTPMAMRSPGDLLHDLANDNRTADVIRLLDVIDV